MLFLRWMESAKGRLGLCGNILCWIGLRDEDLWRLIQKCTVASSSSPQDRLTRKRLGYNEDDDIKSTYRSKKKVFAQIKSILICLIAATLVLEIVTVIAVATTTTALAILPRIITHISSLRSALTLSIIESVSLILNYRKCGFSRRVEGIENW